MDYVDIMAPDIECLKNDEFYLFYEMMIHSINADYVGEEYRIPLSMLRMFLNSGNILVFRKNENGTYVFKDSDSPCDELSQTIGLIINKSVPILTKKDSFSFELNLSDNFKKVNLFHICAGNNSTEEFMLAVVNLNSNIELNPLFWERVKDTMQVIFKRTICYEKNIAAISTDSLTGLDNRNSYEMRLQKLNDNSNEFVFGIFDIFRLKHINDNYTHDLGDIYIKEIGRLLNSYWPKNKIFVNDAGIEKKSTTGHCIYRIGGDEFALLTTSDNLEHALVKARKAKDVASTIKLEVGCNAPVGLNFGIVKHMPGDSFRHTFITADELMNDDKNRMYKKLALERRQ